MSYLQQMSAQVEAAVYRALLRAAMIDPAVGDRRSRKWKRWELGVAPAPRR
jgi:hypothetical protein